MNPKALVCYFIREIHPLINAPKLIHQNIKNSKYGSCWSRWEYVWANLKIKVNI